MARLTSHGNKTMPRTNIKELGITPEQARNIFTGLSREEARAKVEELKAQNSSNQQQIGTFTDKVNSLNRAKNDGYKSMAVGSERNPFSKEGEGFLAKRLYGMTPGGGYNQLKDFFTGGKRGFIADISQITNQETLDKLIDVKNQGATFGALSNEELGLLIESATKIGSWEKKDENGKVIGYDIGEKRFDDELDRLIKLANRAIVQAGGSPVGGNTGQTSNGIKYEIVQ